MTVGGLGMLIAARELFTRCSCLCFSRVVVRFRLALSSATEVIPGERAGVSSSSHAPSALSPSNLEPSSSMNRGFVSILVRFTAVPQTGQMTSNRTNF